MNSMSKYLFDQVHNVCQEVEDSLTEYYRKETQECKVMTSRLVSQYVQRSEKKLKTQKELRNELIPEMETRGKSGNARPRGHMRAVCTFS